MSSGGGKKDWVEVLTPLASPDEENIKNENSKSWGKGGPVCTPGVEGRKAASEKRWGAREGEERTWEEM